MALDPRQLQALMAQMGGAGGAGFSGPPPLCEFKAGRMNYDGKMVTPDRKRGWVRVKKDQQGMVTFEYLDEQKQVMESLYLFPDTAKFVKVKQSDDRVYLLEIQPEPRRLFFWMQDDDKENDAERCKKCHNAINNITEAAPAAGGTAAAGASTSGAAASSGMQTSGFQTSGAAASQNQLYGQNNNQAAQDAMLQQFLSSMQADQQRTQSPGLSSIVTPDSLQKLFSEMSQEDKDELKQHLPDSQQSDEGLRTNLLSPQLRQAMSSLTQACQTSEENVLMILAMCGLDEPNGNMDGVEAMIRGFIKKYEDGDAQ